MKTRSLALAAVSMLTAWTTQAEPIRLAHPENPRYFMMHGKPVILITAAEHYGAVLNMDFDWRKYLATLSADGMNYTRVFAGTYVEPAGAFGIERNTLAPRPGKFISPWARSAEPGYAGGGNKFDLDRFSPEYLQRLRDFITDAGRLGVVVELTLFCSTYSNQQWAIHPFNPTNHISKLRVDNWHTLHRMPANGPASPALDYQLKLVRYLVRELNGFDNLFYEIQNEPWADNQTLGEFIHPFVADKVPSFPNRVEIPTRETVFWQRAIVTAIIEEENKLPQRHLIAQNICNFRIPVRTEDLAPGVSILNFHYAMPEAVTWNVGWPKAIGFDESGFAGPDAATYRLQAWNFVMAGGALFNHLDYSFTVSREDGQDSSNKAPGGAQPELRRHLKVLGDFIRSFDLLRLRPDTTLVQHSPGVWTRVLSDPGRAYALYARGRGPAQIGMTLPEGKWREEWVNVESGAVVKRPPFQHPGGKCILSTPAFAEEIALRLIRD